VPGLEPIAFGVSALGGVVAAQAFIQACVNGDPNSDSCHWAMAAVGISAADLFNAATSAEGLIEVEFSANVSKALALDGAVITVAGASSCNK
jgi:hypothetical protein